MSRRGKEVQPLRLRPSNQGRATRTLPSLAEKPTNQDPVDTDQLVKDLEIARIGMPKHRKRKIGW